MKSAQNNLSLFGLNLDFSFDTMADSREKLS